MGIALPQRFYVVGAVAACLVIASHLIALGSAPPGLFSDEAGFGYNGWTISHYGTDQFGTHWPLFFRSSGDYKGPAGVYLQNVDGDHREALRCEARRRLALASEDTPFSLAARAWAVRGIVPDRR